MRVRLFTLVALLCLLSVPARANEDPDTEIAKRHFNAGRIAYDAGQYEKALGEFTAARRVRPHPALDYNIARCLDRLERLQEAIDAYLRYLGSNPPDAAEVRARVEVLTRRMATMPPKPKPTPEDKTVVLLNSPLLQETSAPPPPRSHKKTVAIVLGVIGGAVVIGAGIAIGLLVKPTTEAATPDSIGGPHPATQ